MILRHIGIFLVSWVISALFLASFLEYKDDPKGDRKSSSVLFFATLFAVGAALL